MGSLGTFAFATSSNFIGPVQPTTTTTTTVATNTTTQSTMAASGCDATKAATQKAQDAYNAAGSGYTAQCMSNPSAAGCDALSTALTNAGAALKTAQNAQDKACNPVAVNNFGTAGITCGTQQLLDGACSLSIYKLLGIRTSDQNASIDGFVQDIVLASTFFIGTVVTVGLIVSGLLMVFSGANAALYNQ